MPAKITDRATLTKTPSNLFVVIEAPLEHRFFYVCLNHELTPINTDFILTTIF